MAEIDNLEDELEELNDNDVTAEDDDDIDNEDLDLDEDANFDDDYREGFFSNRRRLLIIGGIVLGVFLVVAGVVFFSTGSGPKEQTGTSISNADAKMFEKKTKQKARKKRKIKYETLYRQLDGSQLASVLRELSYNSIAFNVVQNGKQYDLEIEETRTEEAKNLLAIKGLPTNPVKGYELFDDASNLGVTEFDKRIRLVRAISGEMEKAIMEFNAIDNAQVEVVMPEQRLFAVTQPPVTASILIRQAPGAVITDEIVFAMMQIVSNSVENLQPQNISVVDTHGNVLHVGVLERMAERQRMDRIKHSQTGMMTQLGKTGQAIPPSMDELVGWFNVKTKYELMLEKRAFEQLVGVLPKDSYKVAVTIDLNSIRETGEPDIKRITTSVVVDNRRKDIQLDAYITKQVHAAVAGAIGYVRGRDTIHMSRADFMSQKKEEPVAKPKAPGKTIDYANYAKYWPIPALGYTTLGILFLVFRMFRSVFMSLANAMGLFKEQEDAPIKQREETLDIPETAFDEMVDGVDEEGSVDAAINKLSYIAKENPDVLRQVVAEWLDNDPDVPEPEEEPIFSLETSFEPADDTLPVEAELDENAFVEEEEELSVGV
ncbi:MAG: hypothetical protein O3A01_05270 [bacterium]|nr:hypothetical protein [bacterium]